MKAPVREVDWLNLQVGRRFVTRSGAVVRITFINPDKIWRFIVCVIERRLDGSECEQPCKISLCPDGKYFPRDEDHPLDLMREVQEVGSIAA